MVYMRKKVATTIYSVKEGIMEKDDDVMEIMTAAFIETATLKDFTIPRLHLEPVVPSSSKTTKFNNNDSGMNP